MKKRKELLSFLFGESQIAEAMGELGDPKKWEELTNAWDHITEEVEAKKEPLAKILSKVVKAACPKGIPAGALSEDPDGFSLEGCDPAVKELIFSGDGLEALAAAGWVPCKAQERVKFIETTTAETSDSEKDPKSEPILKAARKDDQTPAADSRLKEDQLQEVSFVKRGDAVSHKKYGKGTVTRVLGDEYCHIKDAQGETHKVELDDNCGGWRHTKPAKPAMGGVRSFPNTK